MISKLSSNVIPLKQIDDEDILSASQAKGKAHPVKLVQSHVSFAKRFKPLSTESGECDVSDVDKHCEGLSECMIFESSFEHEKGKSACCCM